MGYQITFVPTEEKMNSYKPYNEQSRQTDLNVYKYELMSYCMKKHTETVFSMTKYLTNTLTYFATVIEQYEKHNAYYRWKEDENHWLWYCGWEFAHESQFDKDDIIERYAKDLLIYADLVETPDYFENNEHFYSKLDDVVESIDGFVEIMEDIAIHNIIDDMREFELKDDGDEEDDVKPCYENEQECSVSKPIDGEPCESEDEAEFEGDSAEVPDEEKTLYINTTKLLNDNNGKFEVDTLFESLQDYGADVEMTTASCYDGNEKHVDEFISLDNIDKDEIIEIMKDNSIKDPEKYIYKFYEIKK